MRKLVYNISCCDVTLGGVCKDSRCYQRLAMNREVAAHRGREFSGSDVQFTKPDDNGHCAKLAAMPLSISGCNG